MSRPLHAMMVTTLAILVASCTLVSGLGDFSFGDASTGGDADGDHDGDVEDDGAVEARVVPVDILFIIDSSSGMGDKQELFIGAIQPMLRELVVPTPMADGRLPPAVENLHVGVITTDLGSGGFDLQTCLDDPITGDDGALQAQGRGEGCPIQLNSADCERASCPWLSHSPEHPDDGSIPAQGLPLWEEFGCVAALGVTGCGFEQPLEASLRALTFQSNPGRSNHRFIRDDSLVVLVYLTDEDDCSVSDDRMFAEGEETLGSLATRCAMHGELLHPVERYVEAFRGLRPEEPDMVVVSAIVGIPTDGSWNPGDPIQGLADLQHLDPNDEGQLSPICDNHLGTAYPPVRIAELIAAFGENGIMGSICNPDFFSAAASALAAKIRERMVR